MELRQLECFARTAETGSFTKAAALLHISQPALSKSIALLERNLGVKLFDRNGKRVTLNATGLAVLEEVQAILEHCDRIRMLCIPACEPQNRTVTVRARAASALLPGLLAAFHQEHPEIIINTLQDAGDMQQADADVLLYSSLHEHRYSADRSVLCEPLVMAIPAGHPLAGPESVTLQEAAAFPLCSLRTGHDLRMLEEHCFQQAGIVPRREVECDTPSTLRALLRTGFGIALVPAVTWDLAEDPGLRLLPLRDAVCKRYINVSLPHPEKASGEILEFFHCVVRFFHALQAETPLQNHTGVCLPCGCGNEKSTAEDF